VILQVHPAEFLSIPYIRSTGLRLLHLSHLMEANALNELFIITSFGVCIRDATTSSNKSVHTTTFHSTNRSLVVCCSDMNVVVGLDSSLVMPDCVLLGETQYVIIVPFPFASTGSARFVNHDSFPPAINRSAVFLICEYVPAVP
jgi:hypothetical protein